VLHDTSGTAEQCYTDATIVSKKGILIMTAFIDFHFQIWKLNPTNDEQKTLTKAQCSDAKNNASGQPVEQGTGRTRMRTIYKKFTESFDKFGRSIDEACTCVEKLMRHITRDDRRARYVLRQICNDLENKYKDDPGAAHRIAADKHEMYKDYVISVAKNDLELRKNPVDSNNTKLGIHSFKNNILSKMKINNIEGIINDYVVKEAIMQPNNIKDWNAVVNVYCSQLVQKYGESDALKIFNDAKIGASLGFDADFRSLKSGNGKEYFEKLKISESEFLYKQLESYILQKIVFLCNESKDKICKDFIHKLLTKLQVNCPKINLSGNKDLCLFSIGTLKLAVDKINQDSMSAAAKDIYDKLVNKDMLNRGRKNNNVQQIIFAHRLANKTFMAHGINPPFVEFKGYNNNSLIKESNKITANKLKNLRNSCQ
jgi:hypothetical protein